MRKMFLHYFSSYLLDESLGNKLSKIN